MTPMLVAAALVLQAAAFGAAAQGRSAAVAATAPPAGLEARAAQGDAEAAWQLSRHWRGLTGRALDPARGFAHLQQAAEAGHREARSALGFAYLNGSDGAPRDTDLAYRWLSLAAEAGAEPAVCIVGDFHRDGSGGATRDLALARRWYLRGAAQAHRCAPQAQFSLYRLYADGLGVRKDLREATIWLRKAAEAGHPQAQLALSRAYRDGVGVARDAAEERRWWLRSREGVSYHDDHVHDDESGGPSAQPHTHDDDHDHDHDRVREGARGTAQGR